MKLSNVNVTHSRIISYSASKFLILIKRFD